MINELDLHLKLLSGEPLEIDENAGYLKPLTLREIVRYGYNNYLNDLNVMTLDIEDLVGDDPQIKELGLTVFDLFLQFGGEETVISLASSIEFFFQDIVEILPEEKSLMIGSGEDARIVNRDNFDKVREVIKWQNCINKFSESVDDNPNESDAVRKAKEKLRKNKEMVDKVKRTESSGDSVDITDIISSVSTKSNSINKLNVFDLNVFQLFDEYKRLELIEQYDLGIKSMLAGAKNIDLKHWSGKLDW